MTPLQLPPYVRRLWAQQLVPLLKTKPGYIERLIRVAITPPTIRTTPVPLQCYAATSPQRLVARFNVLCNTMTQKYHPILLNELLEALQRAITEYNALLVKPCTELGVFYTLLPNKRYRAIHAPRLIAIQLSGLNEAAFRLQYLNTDWRRPPNRECPEYQAYTAAIRHPHRVVEVLGSYQTVCTQPVVMDFDLLKEYV